MSKLRYTEAHSNIQSVRSEEDIYGKDWEGVAGETGKKRNKTEMLWVHWKSSEEPVSGKGAHCLCQMMLQD